MLGDAGLLLTDGHDGIGGGYGARVATKGRAAAAAKISRGKKLPQKKEVDQILFF
jgi:hypothetical protein